MYRIVCSDGTVLYDQSDVNGDRVVTEPSCSPEIGQNGGSLSFSMLPTHPAYDLVETMKTYISAEEDGEEIFYGRVTEVRVEKTTDVKQVTCTGAMTFLDDFELTPLKASEQEMTAADFFRYCINGYAEELGDDPKRAFGVGTIDHPKSTMRRTFGLTNYQKVKQALDTFIVKEFGGYLRIRREGGTHVIDWIENYGASNESPIELANNVITHENAITSNEFFTVIHPLGKDGASLPEITVNVDDDLVNEYGRIVRTVSFSNAKNLEELRSDVEEYKTKMAKGLGKTCTVKLIDVHFLDSSVDRLQLGAVYENIAGFEDEGMTVFSMELHFDNPAEDTVTLKNHRELTAVKNGSSTGGKISKIISSAFENIHKHITETAEMLSIHADIIELHGKSIRETATEFERYSRDTDSTIGGILGTGVLQNSDHISQVAGNFTSKYAGVTSTRLNNLIAKGISPKSAGLYEIESIQITKDMIGSGIELFGSPNDALNGVPLDTSSLTEGQSVYRAVLTNDTEVDPQGHYYVKSLLVGTGTEVLLNEYGQQINVYESIDSVKENLLTITGSALWTNREGITGVAGQFEIETDPETQEQRLVVVTGGGMKIRRDNVEYGMYDEYNLTGGLLVNKINDNTTQTKIIGDRIVIGTGQTQKVLTTAMESIENVVGEFEVEEDPETGEKTIVLASGGGMKIRENTQEFGIFHGGNLTGGIIVDKVNGQGGSGTLTRIRGEFVDIEASQVRIGSTSNVQTWMNSTGQDISDLQGLVADRATIAQLNAQKARIDTLEADALTAENIQTSYLAGASISVHALEANNISANSITLTAGVNAGGDITGGDITGNALYGDSLTVSGSVTANGHDISDPLVSASVNGDTLTLTKASGASVTFKKAATAHLVGNWGGGKFTVSADNDPEVISIVEEFSGSTGTGQTNWGNYSITSFDSNHKAYGLVTASRASAPIFGFNVDATSEYTSGYDSGYSAGNTAGYNQGHLDGVDSVTIYKVEQQGAASYSSSSGNYTVSALATASNGNTGSAPITFSGSAAYNAGWTGSYNAVTLSATGTKSLGYGESVTVYPKAKSSSSATAANITSISYKITAPADRYQTGYNQGKLDGVASVTITKVEQQGTITYTNGKFSVPVKATASNSATGSGTIPVDGTPAYSAGESSVTISSVAVNGTPAATATSISVKATASNGATGTGSINISSQRTNAYNSGWTGSYNAVTLSATGTKSLGYGESVTVYPKAKSSSSATAANITDISYKITAPADRYQTGYNAGYNQGELDGIDSVTISKVEQQGAITYSSGNYSVPVKATASNSATGSGTITFAATAAYNAGWNGCMSEIGVSSGGYVTVGGTYYANLYVMNQSGPSRVGYGVVGYNSRKQISSK